MIYVTCARKNSEVFNLKPNVEMRACAYLSPPHLPTYLPAYLPLSVTHSNRLKPAMVRFPEPTTRTFSIEVEGRRRPIVR